MKFMLQIAFLLIISGNALGKGIGRERSNYDVEHSYQELSRMGMSCYPYDTCSSKDEKYENPEPIPPNKCSCHSQCWEYGTCCIDSPYRVKRPIYSCVTAGYFDTYYMVHRCPDNTLSDSIWKIHCERESKNENDILMLSPVTSLETSRTYKNYYCFRCHEEETSKYLSWNLEVVGYDKVPEYATVHSVSYDQTKETWVAVFENNPISIPVNIRFFFPHHAQTEPPMLCYSAYEISDCPDTWNDKRVREKCRGYRSVVYGTGNRNISAAYRNVHCALCNSVQLDDLQCDAPGGSGGSSEGVFRCMIDTTGGGEEEACFQNEEGTCKGENEVWVGASKSCQELKCFPGQILKNKRCV